MLPGFDPAWGSRTGSPTLNLNNSWTGGAAGPKKGAGAHPPTSWFSPLGGWVSSCLFDRFDRGREARKYTMLVWTVIQPPRLPSVRV